ncbi:MAG: MltA domain-containing protein [Candidatus Accumulibacter sp. UW25]
MAADQSDGSSDGLVTGYYEPLLRGSRTRGTPYLEAVLGPPPDLLTHRSRRRPAGTQEPAPARSPAGQQGRPYYTRAEITRGDQSKSGRVLLWVDDPVELFFLQIQGSGRVRLPDGSMTRLAFADQNGHPYQSIGKLLVERGEMSLDQASMQGIKQWARANPTRLERTAERQPALRLLQRTSHQRWRWRGSERGPGVPLTPSAASPSIPAMSPLARPFSCPRPDRRQAPRCAD